MADAGRIGPAASMRVARVGLTALKGARHTARDALELDRDGAMGDRVFCLVDRERRQVLRTVQNPSLVAVRARWDGEHLEVVLPSGEVAAGSPTGAGESVRCDYWGRPVELSLQDGPYAALLSSYLGFPVGLAAAPRSAVIYGAPVSIVTTASLGELAGHLGGGRGHGRGEREGELDSARFRATIVLDAGDRPFLEDDWVGREIRLGDAAVRVADPIPRCAVIDL
ncbi:MAG: MOSC domain-containing protein, partial [Pseudonocardia sp.]